MKRMVLILSLAISLSGTLVYAQPPPGPWHGGPGPCGPGPWGFVGPLLGLGVGFGLGAAWSCNHPREYYYSYPAYPYSPPVYYSQPQAGAPATPAAPVPRQPTVWVPSSPGAGEWVPDPTPYTYAATPITNSTPAKVQTTPQTVTVTRSAGDVPVYVVNASPAPSSSGP